MTESREPADDIPFPAGSSSEAGDREPGSDDDTPLAAGATPHVSFYLMPVGEDDDIPLPEERPVAGGDNWEGMTPEDSHRGEPELEIDTRPISQRAAARQPRAADPNADYLKGLNPEQREAVISTEGPLLVLAGAGTGKTRVLTTRVAHILATRRAWPSQMLVVTFTNKAAREMRERTLALVGPEGEGLRWFGTFHSVSAQILRRHAELVKLKSGFTVLDTDDQLRLIRQILEAENIDQKRWTPRYLASLIDGWKNRAVGPEKLPPDESRQFAEGKGKKLYQIYQDRLATLNAVDFGDLLLHTIRIFTENPEVLADYHAKFKYLLVDEYQDTNVAQYLWLRLLAQGNNNICCVGDDDQSIYGWRGAEVDNILRFERDFPGSKVIRLEQNYRSTAHILAAASQVIAQNTSRLGKTLRTDAGAGDLVKVRGVWDGEQEARLISDDITSWKQMGRRYDNCAVLVRASWQMRAFEERFITTGTPYRVIGGPRFFERAEIRDAMAYLRLIRSEADDLAFERVVNQPKRGVGDTTVQKMHVAARSLNTYLTRAADMMIRGEEIRGPAKTGVRRFILDMERWRAMYAVKDGQHQTEHPRLLEIILEESGYTDMLQADKSPQSQTRLDNLKELVRAMGAFDTLNAFLEHVELVMDNAEGAGSEDQVQILTLHSAKGLEWPMVFLPGWEEEVFPSRRSLDESGAKGLEEERRLAYVGITRARERAYISFVANRQIYGRWTSVLPSRFIDELPPAHVDAVSETGYVSQGGNFYGSEQAGSGATFTSRWDAPGASPGRGASEGGLRGGYDTPGWKRAQAAAATRSNARPPDIEGRAFRSEDSDGRPLARGRTPGDMLASSDPAAAGGIQVGQRIFHDKFGYGRVAAIDGAKLTVDFEKAGQKKVVESFVKRV
ncbi:MAG: UvrD-helicase domain-containing protein [Hyphomonadaceae bacterium]|nr:UvrD-helicase domain-containing protein [Hyphomonadaceae bacterium]